MPVRRPRMCRCRAARACRAFYSLAASWATSAVIASRGSSRCVARQRIDEMEGPRKESSVDARAQRGHQLSGEAGRHDEGGEPRDRRGASSGITKTPSRTPGNRVQLVVEIGERGALARDVDQVGIAPVQHEALAAEHSITSLEQHLGLDVTAADPGSPARPRAAGRPSWCAIPASHGRRVATDRPRCSRRSHRAAQRSALPPPRRVGRSGAVAHTRSRPAAALRTRRAARAGARAWSRAPAARHG